MTHPFLSDLPEPDLKHEIIDAKFQIEQIVGHPIEHFSCPGGRFDRRTLEMARRAGFRTVANSLLHANSSRTSLYELGRVAVLRDMSLAEFAATCRGQGLWKKRLQHGTRRSVQRLLGNRGYDQLRKALLKESEQ
jgi:peptidoglycan/xylan/chitin deacetylase (PgdA/CDA1 family)